MNTALAFSLLALTAAAPLPDADRITFPLAGVSFDPPAGWVAVTPATKSKTVATFAPSAGDATSLVTVEAGKSSGGSEARTTADGLAKSWGGTVDSAGTTLCGTPAWHVSCPPPTGAAERPVDAVVSVHDGLLYLIMGGTTAGHSCADAVERIRASWQWQPIERPADHLTFADQPLPAFKGAALIDVPRFAYRHTEADPSRVLDLSLSDPQRNAPAFLAYAQLAPLPAAADFAAVENALAVGTEKKYHLGRHFTWHDVKGPTPRAMTDAVATSGGAGGRPTSVVWGLVRLDANRAVLVNFTICTDVPADVNTFLAAADRMVESVRVP